MRMAGQQVLLLASSLLLVVSLYGATAWKLDKNLMTGPSRDEREAFKATGWPLDSLPNPMTAAGAVSRLFPIPAGAQWRGATAECFRVLILHPRCRCPLA